MDQAAELTDALKARASSEAETVTDLAFEVSERFEPMEDELIDEDGVDLEGDSRSQQLPVVIVDGAKTALISVEAAKEKIGFDVLDVLDKQFKGSVTEVRHADEGDVFD